jgi:hypothetical protein
MDRMMSDRTTTHSCFIKKMVRFDLLTVHEVPLARHWGAGASVGAAVALFPALEGLEGLAGAGALGAFLAAIMAALESIRTGTRVKEMNFMMTVLMS